MLSATALNGQVMQDASNCLSVAPLATCTLSFTPGNGAVANTSITIQGSNTSVVAASIAVNAASQPTLSIGGSPLVLFANGAAANLTVTNTSVAEPALHVAADLTSTALNGLVTLTASTCSGTLVPSASCTLSFTPGSTGIAQTSFPIAGSNTQTASAAIQVLAIGSSYQGGSVFALPAGGNPGKIAATTDAGTLEWGEFGITNNAQSTSDGATNTTTIVASLGANGGSSYSAQACDGLTDGGFTDWYLPAKD